MFTVFAVITSSMYDENDNDIITARCTYAVNVYSLDEAYERLDTYAISIDAANERNGERTYTDFVMIFH